MTFLPVEFITHSETNKYPKRVAGVGWGLNSHMKMTGVRRLA